MNSQPALNSAIEASEEISQSLFGASGACDQTPATLSAARMLNCSATAESCCPLDVEFAAKRDVGVGSVDGKLWRHRID